MLRASSRRWQHLKGLPMGWRDAWNGLRAATSAAAASTSPLAGGAASAADEQPSTPERVAKVLAHSFHKAPKDTANALVAHMSPLEKVHLVLALQASTKQALLEQKETQYLEDLMKQVKSSANKQHSKLTRQQVQNAVLFQRSLQKFTSVSEGPPTWRQLSAVGLASGLPFVAFGLLDNGIMLIAGEQIDLVFGQRLGLTMMASAGLGNLVADVVGVSATQSVQNLFKQLGWARPPRLSMLQQQQRPVRAAQFFGAALGVAVGCLMGMTPLLFMDPGFFVGAAAAAAAGGGGDLAAGADLAATALSGFGDSAAAIAAAASDGGGAAATGAQQAAPLPGDAAAALAAAAAAAPEPAAHNAPS